MPNTFPSNSIGGAGSELIAPSSGIRLAQDLTAPSDQSGWYRSVTFDPQGSLTEALALSGKWAIFGLKLIGLTAEQITIVLNVDGKEIWNDTFTSSTSLQLYGNVDNTNGIAFTPFLCRNSLSLQVQTLTDTTVTLQYAVSAIL